MPHDTAEDLVEFTKEIVNGLRVDNAVTFEGVAKAAVVEQMCNALGERRHLNRAVTEPHATLKRLVSKLAKGFLDYRVDHLQPVAPVWSGKTLSAVCAGPRGARRASDIGRWLACSRPARGDALVGAE